MNRRNLFFAASALTTVCGALLAQTPQSAGIAFQQAGEFSVDANSIGVHSGGGAVINGFPVMMGPALSALETVTGSPLSATQQSHSLQVLSDGTRIERNESQQVYRDSMGRTRVENGPPGTGRVMIQDPATGVMAVLDPVARTAQKMPAPRVLVSPGNAPATELHVVARAGNIQTQAFSTSTGGSGADVTTRAMAIAPAGDTGGASASKAKPVEEDLPAQSVNGVMATGRRTTLTIPAGEIGNDRPIQVVSEAWYSGDLKMMVKSSNSDPRFGDTSYELTDINRGEPDPSLFQIPADYTVSEPKAVRVRAAQPKE